MLRKSSSTTRTFIPARPEPAGSSGGVSGTIGTSSGASSSLTAGGSGCGSATTGIAIGGSAVRSFGRLTVKVLPLPSSLSRAISPPIISTSSRLIESPSPVPPYCRAAVPSAWAKASKTISCLSAAIPIPVSATAKAMRSRVAELQPTSRLTEPPSVNLRALESRFFSTCRSRPASTAKAGGRPGCQLNRERHPLLLGDRPEFAPDRILQLGQGQLGDREA